MNEERAISMQYSAVNNPDMHPAEVTEKIAVDTRHVASLLTRLRASARSFDLSVVIHTTMLSL